MALQIEDPEIVAEIEAQSREFKITHEEVMRRALAQRRRSIQRKYGEIVAFLDASTIPESNAPMTEEEEAEILGYGPDGLCSS